MKNKMKFEDLSYLQKLRIAQADIDCCENTYIFDILNDEEVWDEIKQHPDWIRAAPETDPYVWKDLMNEAEWDVKAKYAFSIYKAVKSILDKGEALG